MEQSSGSDKFGYGEEGGSRYPTEKEEDRKQKERDSKEKRLVMIANSIKAIGDMTGCGITFCVVLPGYGVTEDIRITSNKNAAPEDRSENSKLSEIGNNIQTVITGFLTNLMQGGYPRDVVIGYTDHIYEVAKKDFMEKTKGIGEGAEPQKNE